MLDRLVQTTLNNNTIDLQRFGFNTGNAKNRLAEARVALALATFGDGTINLGYLNTLLIVAGVITEPIDIPPAAQEIPVSLIEDLLNNVEGILENGTIKVDPVLIRDVIIPIFLKTLVIKKEFKVLSVLASPNGKWPNELGNVIAIDSKYIMTMFVQNFINVLETTKIETGNALYDALIPSLIQIPNIRDRLTQNVSRFDINQFALTVNVLLTDRTEIYSSQATVRPNMLKVTNEIYERLGRNHPSTITSSIEFILNGLFILKNLLDNVFNATVLILVILSMLLIYSLMHSNVEEKTYEFGMLRALGMRQTDLITLLGTSKYLLYGTWADFGNDCGIHF